MAVGKAVGLAVLAIEHRCEVIERINGAWGRVSKCVKKWSKNSRNLAVQHPVVINDRHVADLELQRKRQLGLPEHPQQRRQMGVEGIDVLGGKMPDRRT